MSPIKPGTLCLTINSQYHEWPQQYLGRTLTAVRFDGPCLCGRDIYWIAADWIPANWNLAHREALQPILPPGIDDQVERAIGNPQLEVV